MKRTNFFKTACLTALLVANSFTAPLLAETSGQGAYAACDATMMSGGIAQLSVTHATVNTSILIDATTADVWTRGSAAFNKLSNSSLFFFGLYALCLGD